MQILPIIAIVAIISFVIIFIILLITQTSTKGMEKTLTKLGNVAARAQYNIINNNEEIMKETANKTANINKDAIKTMAHSIKEGFSENDSTYCKYCGSVIDNDSIYCKNCGKKL